MVGHLIADFTEVFDREPDRFEKKKRIQKGKKKVDMYLLEYQVEILMDSESGVLKFRALAMGDGEDVLIEERDIKYHLVR